MFKRFIGYDHTLLRDILNIKKLTVFSALHTYVKVINKYQSNV